MKNLQRAIRVLLLVSALDRKRTARRPTLRLFFTHWTFNSAQTWANCAQLHRRSQRDSPALCFHRQPSEATKDGGPTGGTLSGFISAAPLKSQAACVNSLCSDGLLQNSCPPALARSSPFPRRANDDGDEDQLRRLRLTWDRSLGDFYTFRNSFSQEAEQA